MNNSYEVVVRYEPTKLSNFVDPEPWLRLAPFILARNEAIIENHKLEFWRSHIYIPVTFNCSQYEPECLNKKINMR